ncbi:hypothetical protein IJC60_06125 [bacterium]|nr:hypothetical protein [bacterium]
MYTNDMFTIDLTGCFTSSEIITNVSLALELPNARDKRINLKFKEMVLNQSQLLSIKSLITSYGSQLNSIETTSSEMKSICDSLNIRCIFMGEIRPVEADTISEFSAPKVEETKIEEEEPKEEFSIANNFPQEELEEVLPPVQEMVKEELKEIFTVSEQKEEAEAEDINIEEAIMKSAQVAYEAATEKTEEEKIAQSEAIEYIFSEIPKEAPARLEAKAYDFEDDMPSYTKAQEDETEGEAYNFYEAPTDEPVVATSTQTIYVTQTLRSGQVIEYDGNIVIIGDCHPGSEIKATGDITVWGVLGSIAHAGIKGNRDAKIRALKLNAVQLRIADTYSRRPDGTNIPYIIKSTTCTPEEARLTEDGIILYKLN